MDAVKSGHNILIVSDRKVDADQVAIPALLATSAIHQHLVQRGLRTSTGLVVETGSARETHHFALLAGYGAEAVHPYLALETLVDLAARPAARDVGREGDLQLHQGDRQGPDEGDVEDGHLDLHVVLRRADLRSRRPEQVAGRQVLHAAPRRTSKASACSKWPRKRCACTRLAFGNDPVLANALDAGGEYAFRVRGEDHMWTPDAIAKLQHSTRANNFSTYKEYAQIINDQSRRHLTLRGLFEFKLDPAKAIPLDEVEPAKEIVKRFATGAMSLGSISTEAHATLAIAMNRIGGKSNTGEGGEDPARYSQGIEGHPDQAGRDPGLRASARTASRSTSRCRTAIRCARRSSRWPRAASASPPST